MYTSETLSVHHVIEIDDCIYGDIYTKNLMLFLIKTALVTLSKVKRQNIQRVYDF